jgi:hypothetical protein
MILVSKILVRRDVFVVELAEPLQLGQLCCPLELLDAADSDEDYHLFRHRPGGIGRDIDRSLRERTLQRLELRIESRGLTFAGGKMEVPATAPSPLRSNFGGAGEEE